MTTTDRTTPYDKAADELRATSDNREAIRLLYAKAVGYRRALEDVQPLLEAAKAAYVDLSRWQDAEQRPTWDDEDDVTLIRLAEAIAQATPKE